MRLPSSKIESIAEKDTNRAFINGVLYDAQDKVFVATNGHAMAIVPTNDPESAPASDFFIPSESVKLIRQVSKGKDGVPNFIPNCTSATANNGLQVPIMTAHEFPSWRLVLPKAAPAKSIATISIDAKLLLDLATAISKDSTVVVMTIELDEKRTSIKPIHVTASKSEPGAYGIIMPCRQ